MSKKIEIKLFGSFEIVINDETLQLDNILGRQMSSLFALLIINHNQIITKEVLIERLWSDSENPTSAIKFAIHRLRNILKTAPAFSAFEWILTKKNGYQFNGDIEFTLDVDIFENLIQKGKDEKNYVYIAQALEYYRDIFLGSLDTDWVVLDRGYYSNLYFQAVELISYDYLSNNKPTDAVDISGRALMFEPYNEEIIFIYLKGLITAKRYQSALTYFESIAKKYHREMGVPLDTKISKLLNIVSANETSSLKTDVNEHTNNLFAKHNLLGAFFCSYESFKSIAQFEIRNCIRNRTDKYILYLEMQCDDSLLPNAMTKLLNIADGMLRINDVYSRISLSQIAIMINLTEESQAFIVIERILSRFFKKHSRYDYRINYNVQNIVNSSLIKKYFESNKPEK